MTTRSFIVGHNDRSIKYTSGYWIEFVDESGSSSHFTTDKPATARFEFDGSFFSSRQSISLIRMGIAGTMVSILGTFKVDGTGANTSLLYTLDGRDDRSFPLKSIGPPPSHSLYLSPWLSQGRHTLVLALSGRAALFIDGMNVTTGSTLKGPANATHERRHIGAIVGGTLGGVVFIVLLCLFFLVYRRHRHRKARPTG